MNVARIFVAFVLGASWSFFIMAMIYLNDIFTVGVVVTNALLIFSVIWWLYEHWND